MTTRQIIKVRGISCYADSLRQKNTGSGVACAASVAAGRECPAVNGALIEYIDAVEESDAPVVRATRGRA